MKFIDILGNEIKTNCLGCDIANHKIEPPGGYVYDDGFINISADPEIPIPGFVVLGIKKHVKSFNELTMNERVKIIEILNITIQKIKECKIADEILILQEERAKHFHIWIFPIHDWMNKYGKKARNIDKIIKYSKQMYNEDIKQTILQYIKKLTDAFKQ